MATARVLLIDDDEDFVAIHKLLLNQHGYEVVVAYDGDEGMAAARLEKPDVIVLDYMMTRPTEGSFVAQEIKEDPDLRRIPIILLTAVRSAHPWWNIQKNETSLPVEFLLDKPVNAERLLEVISQAAAGSR